MTDVTLDAGTEPAALDALYQVLYTADLQSDNFDLELQGLEARYGGAVFSELIYLLSEQKTVDSGGAS